MRTTLDKFLDLWEPLEELLYKVLHQAILRSTPEAATVAYFSSAVLLLSPLPSAENTKPFDCNAIYVAAKLLSYLRLSEDPSEMQELLLSKLSEEQFAIYKDFLILRAKILTFRGSQQPKESIQ